jgi:hypothetical protein
MHIGGELNKEFLYYLAYHSNEASNKALLEKFDENATKLGASSKGRIKQVIVSKGNIFIQRHSMDFQSSAC